MPDHLTPGVHPFTPDDPTDEIQLRVLELGLQGLSDDMAMVAALIESSMTYERRADMQRRQALIYLAEHADDPDLPEDWRRVLVKGIGP